MVAGDFPPSTAVPVVAGSSLFASKSFVDVLAGVDIEPSVSIKQPQQYKGKPAVFFSQEEFYAVPRPFQFALVGKFSSGIPTMEALRQTFPSIGLKGGFTLSHLDFRHVLIRVSLEEDYLRLWLKQLWQIAGFPMRIFKWTPDFKVTTESPLAPVWVCFEQLPLSLFVKSHLFSIASTLGKPLKLDRATVDLTRPHVAKVCVELDVSKPLESSVWIGVGESGFWQPVVYEGVPSYCSHCCRLGHDVSVCRVLHPPTSVQPSQPKWREKGRVKAAASSQPAPDARMAIDSVQPALDDAGETFTSSRDHAILETQPSGKSHVSAPIPLSTPLCPPHPVVSNSTPMALPAVPSTPQALVVWPSAAPVVAAPTLTPVSPQCVPIQQVVSTLSSVTTMAREPQPLPVALKQPSSLIPPSFRQVASDFTRFTSRLDSSKATQLLSKYRSARVVSSKAAGDRPDYLASGISPIDDLVLGVSAPIEYLGSLSDGDEPRSPSTIGSPGREALSPARSCAGVSFASPGLLSLTARQQQRKRSTILSSLQGKVGSSSPSHGLLPDVSNA